jgi:hypothetical protein
LTVADEVSLEVDSGNGGGVVAAAVGNNNSSSSSTTPPKEVCAIYLKDPAYGNIEYITVAVVLTRNSSLHTGSAASIVSSGSSGMSASSPTGPTRPQRVVIDEIFVRTTGAAVKPEPVVGDLRAGATLVAIDSVPVVAANIDATSRLLSSTGLPHRTVITVSAS